MKTIFFKITACVLAIGYTSNLYAQQTQPINDTDFSKAIENLAEKLQRETTHKDFSASQVQNTLSDTDRLLEEALTKRRLFSKKKLPINRKELDDSDSLTVNPVKLARLRILNKITGHAEEKIVENGIMLPYGTLNIKLYDCIFTRTNRRIDAMTLLEITEKTPEDFINMSLVGQELEIGKKLFFGWIIQSAPAASLLEHPVYDITLKGCGT